MIAIRPVDGHRVVHPLQEGRDSFLSEQMLEEVRDPHTVEVRLGQLCREHVRDDRVDARIVGAFGVLDLVDGPTLAGGNRVDEFATSRGRVEHSLRRPHLPVDERSDLPPDCGSRLLIHVPKPILVEPLIVHVDTLEIAPEVGIVAGHVVGEAD
jgi:hypothetical protein